VIQNDSWNFDGKITCNKKGYWKDDTKINVRKNWACALGLIRTERGPVTNSNFIKAEFLY
jgi:hypothetical protein